MITRGTSSGLPVFATLATLADPADAAGAPATTSHGKERDRAR